MPNLRQCQLEISQHLLQARERKPLSTESMKHVKQASRQKSLNFQAYINNEKHTLIRCLQINFPICRALVGDNCFFNFSDFHYRQHPSRSRSLDNYGHNFHESLKVIIEQNVNLETYAYLIDVALFEWISIIARNASKHQIFDPTYLQQMDNINSYTVCLELQDDLQLISSHYDLLSIYNFHTEEVNAIDEKTPPKTASPYYILLQQPNNRLLINFINGEDYRLLEAIQQSIPINALSSYCAIHDDELFHQRIAYFMQKNWIKDVTVKKRLNEKNTFLSI